MNFIKSFFSKRDFSSLVERINFFEPDLEKLSDAELKNKSGAIKNRAREGALLDELLPEAFALVREAARRTLGQRHFDVQLIGGIVLHEGKIAEMATGEGKTLAATTAVFLNALSGKGVHILTVNDYLARRDAVWMGQIYDFLGLSTSCITHDQSFLYDPAYEMLREPEAEKEKKEGEQDAVGGFKVVQEFLRPASRKEAYQADITYGTINEFGFDYLRDNLAYNLGGQVQRQHYFAIVDEADSILIDEARTPLIIAAPDAESSQYYKVLSRIAANLAAETDYAVDEKMKSVLITDEGIAKVEKMLGLKNLYDPANFRLVHYLEESLKAKALFQRDKNYVVKDGEIIIVDEFTGRLMPGRRYSGGLHQAIEAKEGVFVKEESKTYAQITIQNYVRLYEKISGMTGTAQTSAEEFDKVYNLEVVTVPTNKPVVRVDLPDLIFKNVEAKYGAVIEEIREKQKIGQPVLVGTASINHNEILSGLLKQANIRHEVLNAKNHEREGAIIAQAGKLGAVTVATNMAGRGVDIILGGNPPQAEAAKIVKEAGGLHVIGTERHEARRIDNQLRGRSGRQGDAGSSRFFLSLEDDLLRIFGGERVKSLMETFNLPEDQPLESSLVNKVVVEAQKKIEGLNFDARKHLLDYDNVLNKQRTAVYKRRQEILEKDAAQILTEIVDNSYSRFALNFPGREELEKALVEIGAFKSEEIKQIEDLAAAVKNKSAAIASNEQAKEMLRQRMLSILDFHWMSHLENLEALLEAVRIRAYGQHDPLVEYRRDGLELFKNLFSNVEDWIFNDLWKLRIQAETSVPAVKIEIPASSSGEKFKNVGRNDPCPCGAINPATGKVYKWKQCGLINAPHHKG